MRDKLKRTNKRMVAAVILTMALIGALVGTRVTSIDNAATKPGAVKNLKKVKTTKNSIKVKYKKVKGAEGYQILIYQKIPDDGTSSPQTPLVYAKTTKKTTYTIKNLMPGNTYTVKVRAYNREGVYGKFKSVKAKTTGPRDLDIVCNSCGVCVPDYRGNKAGCDYTTYLADHIDAAWEILGESHCGFTEW